MTTEPTALAEAPVSIDDVLAVVDELAIASSPNPRAKIVRVALITQLRDELAPSIGSTGTGRGGAGIPIDVGMLTLWEDVTARIEALHEDLEGEAPAAGSHEQILLAWSRELAAAAASTYGLNQDALRYALHRVTRIRDLIRDHFDPPRTGDIPGIACDYCDATTAEVDRDGEIEIMPALGWSSSTRTGLVVTCRACGVVMDQDFLEAIEAMKWATRLTRLHRHLVDEEWARLRVELWENPIDITDNINLWQLAARVNARRD